MRPTYAFVLTAALLPGLLTGCSKKQEAAKSGELNISGTIQIDPGLAKYTKKSDTIFLVARPSQGGPPVAVVKFSGRDYPYAFKLGNQDLMMHGQETQETPLDLSVRVDKDGEAMTRNPGDLYGIYEKNPVPFQAEGVVITVNEVRQ